MTHDFRFCTRFGKLACALELAVRLNQTCAGEDELEVRNEAVFLSTFIVTVTF